MRVGRQFGS